MPPSASSRDGRQLKSAALSSGVNKICSRYQNFPSF